MNTILLDVIIGTLKKYNGVAHYKEITRYIEDNNLYDFSNAKTPSNTVSAELQKYSKETKYGKDNIFYSVHCINEKRVFGGLLNVENLIQILILFMQMS